MTEQHQLLRQNRDLVEAINEVFKNHLAIGSEIDELKGGLESLEESNQAKMIEQNNIIMEIKNNFGKRIMNYQTEQAKIWKMLENYEKLRDEFEITKNNNTYLHLRIKKLENDIIDLQNHIIRNNNITESNISIKCNEDKSEINEFVELPTRIELKKIDNDRISRLLDPTSSPYV